MTLPVTLEEAKRQLKVEEDETDQNNEIEGFIRDAAAWVEDYTGQILEARDVEEHFSGFRPVALGAWPIVATTAPHVIYTSPDGLPGMYTAKFNLASRPARALPLTGSFWPFVDSAQAFSVTFRAGYEDPNDVPRGMCRAMLLLIAAYDADREGGKILGAAEAAAKRLCRRFKRQTL